MLTYICTSLIKFDIINNTCIKRKRSSKMKLNFDYKGIKINYELTYKKINAISINIDSRGKVNVVAPLGTSVYAVMDKVKGNAPWIISQLYKGKVVKPEVKLLEQYTYLGKNYRLELIENSSIDDIKVKMARGKFVVETPTDNKKQIRTAILEWYKDKLVAKLKERLKAYGEQFNIVPSEIEIGEDPKFLFRMNNSTVFSNVKVGMMTGDVIDYIVVSSLCRINYEEDMAQEKLQEILPDYEKSKEWLETNKNQLSL